MKKKPKPIITDKNSRGICADCKKKLIIDKHYNTMYRLRKESYRDFPITVIGYNN